MLVPGIATLVMVPFHMVTYLNSSLSLMFPAFIVTMFLAAVFFGPSFAMTQALASLRMRSVATSILLFMQTLIGFGIGPWGVGRISDWLRTSGVSLPMIGVVGQGMDSLRWALVFVGFVNLWAAAHYFYGARFLLDDLAESERLEAEATLHMSPREPRRSRKRRDASKHTKKNFCFLRVLASGLALLRVFRGLRIGSAHGDPSP